MKVIANSIAITSPLEQGLHKQLMKHFRLLGCVTCLLFFTTYSYAQLQLSNWGGRFVYTEKPVKSINGVTAMVADWQLDVKMADHTLNYTGLLEVNGQQTYYKYLTDIVPAQNGVKVVFNTQVAGAKYDYNQPKRGDVLFTLVRQNGAVITKWGILKPILADRSPKSCRCFIKIKGK